MAAHKGPGEIIDELRDELRDLNVELRRRDERIAELKAEAHLGTTKRELFAAMAMQGMLQAGEEVYPQIFDSVARDSLMFADALIEALKDE